MAKKFCLKNALPDEAITLIENEIRKCKEKAIKLAIKEKGFIPKNLNDSGN